VNDEERQRQMDFILQQQSRFAADMRRWREDEEERWKKADERWARTEVGIRGLLTITELHEQEIRENSRQIVALGEMIGATRVAGRETDERLNALINTVERLVSERRDGGPQEG